MEVLPALFSQLIRVQRGATSIPRVAEALRKAKNRSYFSSMFQHERMLADPIRVGTYQRGIERRVTSNDVVLDVGTGTGVLAFFAARKARRVYALDHSPEMIEYARAAARMNGLTNITFVASSSRDFRAPEPIDVIVQEQMGTMLFHEAMVESITDLRDRCLRVGGRVLPGTFEYYLEPVQVHDSERVPLVEELNIDGLRFPTSILPPSEDYFYRAMESTVVEHLLCEPAPVYTFDLSTVKLDQLPKRFAVSKPFMRSGRFDGVCSYFKASFDNEITLSTGPDAPKTCWTMIMYRVPARACRAGERFEMQVDTPHLTNHMEWKWQIGVG